MRPYLFALLLSLMLSTTPAHAETEAVQTGRLLALLLDCGRVTVAANQTLIDNPEKGFKGFTPESFEQQLIAVFKERSGIDLTDLDHAEIPPMAKPLLSRLLAESKKTIATYQPAINIAGIKYKGLIPATFGTETATRFQAWSGIYLKQTAPDAILRNPKNKADAVEAAMLRNLAMSPSSRRSDEVQILEDGKAVHVFLPLFYGKPCLLCHGEPKGERDVTGYPKEGGKEGDLAGGISVKIETK